MKITIELEEDELIDFAKWLRCKKMAEDKKAEDAARAAITVKDMLKRMNDYSEKKYSPKPKSTEDSAKEDIHWPGTETVTGAAGTEHSGKGHKKFDKDSKDNSK